MKPNKYHLTYFKKHFLKAEFDIVLYRLYFKIL